MKDMIHPLARARGHGSARSGVHHWVVQRISAVVLLLLLPWLAYAVICVGGSDYAAAAEFAARPWNAAFLLLTLLTLVYHGMLGMQVVIEDYVHHRGLELALHFAVRAGAILAAAFGVIHILKLAQGA